MNEELKLIVKNFVLNRREVSKEDFLKQIQEIIGYGKQNILFFIEKTIATKNELDISPILSILWALDGDDEYLQIIHRLFLEPWHYSQDLLLEYLDFHKNPKSVPILKAAMQKKFPRFEQVERTSALINACGHVLWRMRTPEALNVIKELSESDDPVLKDEMLYRLARIEGRDDYERKF